jgi:hypothetical protein
MTAAACRRFAAKVVVSAVSAITAPPVLKFPINSFFLVSYSCRQWILPAALAG